MDSNSLEVLKASFDLPILTREQEIALFRQFQAGGPNAQEAREKIFLHNLRLVRNLARKMFPNIELEDKIQWGVFGLNRAVDRFELTKNCKFSTYASPWIKQAISREAAHYSSVGGFNLPSHMYGDYHKLMRIISHEKIDLTLELIMNHPEMMKTVKGKRVKIGAAKARKLLELTNNHGPILSLNHKVVSGEGREDVELGDFLPDKKAEAAFSTIFEEQTIDSLLSCLSVRQRLVVTQHLLDGNESLRIVGKKLGMSATRAGQILDVGLRRMRRMAIKLGFESSQLPR